PAFTLRRKALTMSGNRPKMAARAMIRMTIGFTVLSVSARKPQQPRASSPIKNDDGRLSDRNRDPLFLRVYRFDTQLVTDADRHVGLFASQLRAELHYSPVPLDAHHTLPVVERRDGLGLLQHQRRQFGTRRALKAKQEIPQGRDDKAFQQQRGHD